MPVGVEIVRSASSSIIRVLVKAGRLSSFQMERGIRLMLAPRSAKAKHSFISGKSHGAGAGVWFFLSRINALTISFSSATSRLALDDF
ncbi:hypothetical protein Tco_0641152 [Tanacetum coccineum]